MPYDRRSPPTGPQPADPGKKTRPPRPARPPDRPAHTAPAGSPSPAANQQPEPSAPARSRTLPRPSSWARTLSPRSRQQPLNWKTRQAVQSTGALRLGALLGPEPAHRLQRGHHRCRRAGRDSGSFTGEVVAEHALVAPGETSICDEHYGSSRPDNHGGPRGPRPGRAGVPRDRSGRRTVSGRCRRGRVQQLPGELAQILTLHAAHGNDAVLAALERAVQFKRWRADDVRWILAAAGAAPQPRPAGQALVLTLPSVPTRSLADYAIDRAPSGTTTNTGGDLS